MKISISYISIFLLLLITSTAIGQNAKKADELFNRMGYQVAIDHYGDSEDLSIKQRIRLAESHRLNGHSDKAEMLYRTIIKVDQTPIHYFHLAQALMMNNKVDEAITNFEIYKSFLSPDDTDQRADNFLRFIQSKSFDHVGSYEIKNIESLNTDNFEFSPFIVNDGILFVSSRPNVKKELLASVGYSDFGNNNKRKDLWTEKDYNKIYKSIKDDEGQLNQTTILSESLKGPYHQGPLHINDAEDLLYFTSSHILNDAPSKNNREFIPLEIYKSLLIGKSWSEPVPFNEINTPEYNEAHPTLSNGGRMIIFASDREGGFGGMDLYISHKIDGHWSIPENMGSSVNTPGNEVFPFLHPTGQLYFSSDGLGGYGGLDIFQISINKKRQLGKSPINIGFPINSTKDDFGYNSQADNLSGYFSSSRSSSIGRDDIFSFKKGKPTAKDPKESKEETVASLELETSLQNTSNYINPSPTLQSNTLEIAINTKESNAMDSDVSNVKNTAINNIITNDKDPEAIDNKNMAEGNSFTLDKIYYDFDKATLRDESIPELNKLTNFLNQYPDVTIELSSHTDSRGPDHYNVRLSQNRAEAVVDFLINHEIDKYRIIAKGYGEERLRNTCKDGRNCSEEDHQYNRRTEFKILDLGNNVNLAYTDHGPGKNYTAGSQPSKSFSNVTIKESIAEKYSNVSASEVDKINEQLVSDGAYIITVGAYSNPSKKLLEMKSLGFRKIRVAPIDGRRGISRVLIGSTDDLSSAQQVSQTLYEMGIKHDILTLD